MILWRLSTSLAVATELNLYVDPRKDQNKPWINVFWEDTKNYLMTYPSMSASGGMVQESRIPLEPTGVPSRSKGGPGTGRKKSVWKREEKNSLFPHRLLCSIPSVQRKSNTNILINNFCISEFNRTQYQSHLKNSFVVCGGLIFPVCVFECVDLSECVLGPTRMNKALHSSGISLTFTADPFILRFKSPGLSYLRGIKQGREYTSTHTQTLTPHKHIYCTNSFNVRVCTWAIQGLN